MRWGVTGGWSWGFFFFFFLSFFLSSGWSMRSIITRPVSASNLLASSVSAGMSSRDVQPGCPAGMSSRDVQ
ncbi:MAG: hypothetical protein ABGY24_05175 [bacterium]